MNYFFDTEFMEDGRTIELLSIGIVNEKGGALYCENYEADFSHANEWVKVNVLPNLHTRRYLAHPDLTECLEGADENLCCPKSGEPLEIVWMPDAAAAPVMPRDLIRQCVLSFVGLDPDPVFWGYYADYDWVVLCQLFGRMIDLPQGWPMYCRDLKQWAVDLGNPRLPKQTTTEHNALNDARWNQKVYNDLLQLEEDIRSEF